MPKTPLGQEEDGCAGPPPQIIPVSTTIKVRDRGGNWVHVTQKETPVAIDIQVDGDGWWYWRCCWPNGQEHDERTRGAGSYRFRINHVEVRHMRDGEILWDCFEVT